MEDMEDLLMKLKKYYSFTAVKASKTSNNLQ